MKRSLYDRLIAPMAKEPDQATREIVLNYLLVGIFIFAFIDLADAIGVYATIRQGYLLGRILSIALTVLFVAVLYRIARRSRYQRAMAVVLTLMITAAGVFLALQWGVLNPNDPVLFSLAVVMAGILIGARYALYLACLATVALVGLQFAETHGYIRPDLSWVGTKPTVGDVVGFSAILFIIAFVSWLYSRQMELALRRARRSEKALQRQKALLEIKVQQRTQQLEATQLEQLQELYRFAELGRVSTALFHDLANHLSTVSVDIEGLQHEHQSSIMQRIQDNVRHVDGVVQRVRQQIQGKTTIEAFDVLAEIREVIELQSLHAAKFGVLLVLEPGEVRAGLTYKGDILRFRQILMNLIANGIEAHEGRQQGASPHRVLVRVARARRRTNLTVSDTGTGITKAQMARIFEPFYSTKTKGVGIGLFLVKQVVEHDFHGTIALADSSKQGSTFVVSLPGGYYAQSARS